MISIFLVKYLIITMIVLTNHSYFYLLHLSCSHLSLVSHAPSGPPYTPASYSHGIASLAGWLTSVRAVNT